MEMLQIREKEIFETLKNIKSDNFIVIGGYAVNAYALPRFSVDCDIVMKELGNIGGKLEKSGYIKVNSNVDLPYHGNFLRYEKTILENFKVSVDILLKEVYDRQTKAKFDYKWVFDNSKIINLKGKTVFDELKLRIINLDSLIVMKMVSCKETDIRDIFMLIIKANNLDWIKNEVAKRCDFKDRFNKLKIKITSEEFKNNLQGVYGYIEESLFNKHKEAILKLGKI